MVQVAISRGSMMAATALLLMIVSRASSWSNPSHATRLALIRNLKKKKKSPSYAAIIGMTSRTSSSHLSAAAPAATEAVVRNVPKNFVPYPFQYHEELTLRVHALTNLGMGICRTPVQEAANDAATGGSSSSNTTSSAENIISESAFTTTEWVIFVPNVCVGELVRLKVYRNHKSYSDADLLDVVEPSPDRQEPLCKLADKCGGCQYQHMTIDVQRKWKTEQVKDGLERIGGFTSNNSTTTQAALRLPQVSPTVGTEHIWHYRSKITPHYERPRKLSPDSYQIEAIGFKEKSSRRLVDVDYCHIATEAINDKLTSVRETRRNDALEGKLKKKTKGATLLLRHADEGVVTDPNQYVTTQVAGLTFRFLAGNFFQNNPFMLPTMVNHVIEAANRPAAAGGSPSEGGGQEMTHLIDCYCGSGLFCLSAAKTFEVCVGIEVNKKAVEEAQANADLNDIQNCDFVAASAEAIFESKNTTNTNNAVLGKVSATTAVREFPRDKTVVVCDPPRKGCSEEFLEQLYEFGPQRIVYMSCDPATQARDAKGIVGAGYTITSVQPFDLFPQTRHIECLVVFERN